jgi:hypothetical protein
MNEETIPTNKYLTEKESMAISYKIAKLLNGVSIGQAGYILSEAKALIYDCHAVDIDNPRFKIKTAELEGFGVSFD